MGFAFLYNEINAFCVFIIILMAAKSELVVGKNAHSYYLGSLINIISCIVMDSIWFMVEKGYWNISVEYKYVIYSIYFVSFTVFGYGAYLCVDYLGNAHANSRVEAHYIAFGFIPMHIALTVLNYYFGFLFRVDAVDGYSRGPLFIMQYVFLLAYTFIAWGRIIGCMTKGETEMEKEKYIAILCFPLLPMIALAVQMYRPELPLISISITAAALILYFDLAQNVISLDPMTGLNNKKQFKAVLRRKMAESDKNTDLYVLMIDIDKFKQINDTYGHIEGDKAIIRTASALRTASVGTTRRTTLSRFGGDEFVVLLEYEKDKRDEAQDEIRQFSSKVKQSILSQGINACVPYDMHVSIGVAMFNETMKNADDVICAADSDLYVKKQEKDVNIGAQVTYIQQAAQ